MAKQIRVTAVSHRFTFDGQTAIVVVNGTPGTVQTLDLDKAKATPQRDGIANPLPTLTVAWDVALLQDAANDDSATSEMWVESGVPPDHVTFLNIKDYWPDADV